MVMTIKNITDMGANGSYDKSFGGVPKDKRTHTDTGYTILGHKVLVQTGKEKQTSNILNSNSENSVYLIAKLNEDGTLTVWDVNINKGHQIDTEINLVFDSQGNIVPYNGKKTGSHSHKWIKNPDGDMVRKPFSNNGNTHLPIPPEYSSLNNAIENFNKQKNKIKKK